MRTLLNSLSVSLLLVSAMSSAQAGISDGRLDVYWVDVEGGAATLIVTPQERVDSDRYRKSWNP